jgi:hypothetical protein
MAFTLTSARTWVSGETVTATKLNTAAVPTLADNQTYAFAAGAAASPSASFNGDSNTGTYSPAADQWAVAVGGVQGLKVSSSGTEDAIGNVRTIPLNSQTSVYTPVVTDNGKVISITTGGVAMPVGVMSAGMAFSIFNNSGSSQNITAAGTTLYQAGTANTGTRVLDQRGLCTVLCVAANTFVISGAGIS